MNLPIFLFLNREKEWKKVFLFALRRPNLPSFLWNISEKKHVILLHSKMILISQVSYYKLLDMYSYITISNWANLRAVMWSMWSDFSLRTQLKVANPWDLRQKTWTQRQKHWYKLLQKLRMPFVRRECLWNNRYKYHHHIFGWHFSLRL